MVARSPELNEEVLAITRDGAFIGVIGVRLREANTLQRGAGPNIGYWIGEPFWGHGFMTEAVQAVVRYLFEQTQTDAIYCGAFTRECCVAAGAGEGRLRPRRRDDAVFKAARRRLSARQHRADAYARFQAGGMLGGA